jgi:ubiquinone/menaquinone biosynthesis C-methylase UbiE
MLSLLPKTGQNVLDIATGYGEPAVTAAKIIQPGGSVIGVDVSPQMLEIARERAANLGLHDIIRFEEGDIDKLSLQQESFDAIHYYYYFVVDRRSYAENELGRQNQPKTQLPPDHSN